MSLGLLFAKRDDPASEKLFSGMMNLQLWIGLALLTIMFGAFFIRNLNLFLGIERECTITVLESKVTDNRKKTRLVKMETNRGHKFEQSMGSFFYKRLGAKPGETAEVKTDGLFWTAVVAVKTDKGWENVY